MPTYAIIDSQSVKTASSAHDKGFDGGKKIKGRKRHIAVDTLVNLLSVMVHAANIHDTRAGIFVAKKAFETYPSLKGFCADAGYRNTFEREVSEQLGLTVEISKKNSRYFLAYSAQTLDCRTNVCMVRLVSTFSKRF